MKIAIWWNIPCKSIVPVARELADLPNVDVTFISQSDLSESRKKLGWELPSFGNAEYEVLSDDNFQKEVELFMKDNYDIHIFNGVYLFPKIRYALDLARKQNIKFGVISEAYHNPYKGFKRVLKTIFTRTITPFRVFPRIKNAQFILGASGNNEIPFLNLGWKKEQFFPFGYFPENEGLNTIDKINNEVAQILCTGYITKNKGQSLLIRALNEIKQLGIPFYCNITGFGPDEEDVKKLVKYFNLEENINFTGVLSDEDLNSIKLKADLLVAPGYEEPWGIRINEALLANTPVIVSDKIGACELIYASEAGRVFKSGNLDSLVHSLKNILQKEELLKSRQKAKLFADNVTPKSAAQYLYNVILYSTNNTDVKPFPAWLKK